MKLIITCAIAAWFTWILPGGQTLASNWEHQSSPWGSTPDPGWALDWPNGMAWALGPDGTTIRSPIETAQPTSLSWSIVPGGTGDAVTAGRYTEDITSLGVAGLSGITDYQNVLGGVIDEWASVCGITNLGYVEEDGSVLVGGVGDTNADGFQHITDRGPAAGAGHVRFMAFDSNWIPPSKYAQATFIPEPGSQVDNIGNNRKAGDVRFRSDANIWGLGSDSLHFRNIALHEVGHVLGFGHNSISDSVMSYPYTEWNLGTGDVEGAIAIYSRVTVPEPDTLMLLSLGSLGLLRRRKQAKKPVSTM
jgi:hypothetical protein